MAFPPEIGTLLSDVVPEKVQWLWQGRIPLGKITILDGDPGLGKSVMTLDLSARVSTGREMPDGTPGREGGVVLVNGEDGLADTIRPRLDAAGADPTRIIDLTFSTHDKSKLLRLPDDVAKIEHAIKRVGAILVVIDPILGFLNEKANSDKDSHMRAALTPLAKMAERLGVAVILLRHLNKSEQEKAIYRGGGSIALIGLARSGLLVGKAMDGDGMILANTKANLAKPPKSLRYRLTEACNGAVMIEWTGEASVTADQLVAGTEHRGKGQKTEEAAELLQEWLSDGPMHSKQLEALAEEAGISLKTYHRARKAAGVISRPSHQGWTCSLPSQKARWPDGQMASTESEADGSVSGLA